MTEILSAENLHSLGGVRHAFFTRAWGNGGFSGQENPTDVFDIRARMAAQLGVAAPNLLCCHQIHSTEVVVVKAAWPARENPHADAMVTTKHGLALGVLTADCGPVLLVDSAAGVIGAAHAGWRGALNGILENTLTAMESLGARRSAIHAALGPCIWQRSYEVGPAFPDPFMEEDAANRAFFHASTRHGHHMFNLPGYIEAKLRRLGVPSVEASPADTCAEPERFFSYRYSSLRGETRSGNLMSAIALAE